MFVFQLTDALWPSCRHRVQAMGLRFFGLVLKEKLSFCDFTLLLHSDSISSTSTVLTVLIVGVVHDRPSVVGVVHDRPSVVGVVSDRSAVVGVVHERLAVVGVVHERLAVVGVVNG